VLYIPDGDEPPMGEATPAEMRLRCSSLGWGGRHALTFSGGMPARSLARRLAAADTLSGGWALYLERRLFVATDDDAERHAALLRRRQAIAAARVDLDLHCGTIDATAAAARMQALSQSSVSNSLHQVAQVVRHPGDALAVVLGWQLIEAAAARDGGPEAAVLHQRLLGQGAIPLSLVMTHAVGDTHWQAALSAVGLGSDAGANASARRVDRLTVCAPN